MKNETAKSVGTGQIKPKLVIPGKPTKPILIVKGAPITPIIIKPVS